MKRSVLVLVASMILSHSSALAQPVSPASLVQGSSPTLGTPSMPANGLVPETRESAPDARTLAMGLQSQAGPIDPKQYVLGPGDVLQLEFWGRVQRSTTIPVDPQGRIFLAGYGSLDLAGRTLEWAQSEMERIVARRFVGVRTELRLMRMRTFRVYLSGLLSRAGALEVTPAMRASEVVSHVGLDPTASRRNIVVRRRDGTELRLDLDLYANTGRMERNPTLLDGDVIFAPRAAAFIEIHGAIANPGRYEWTAEDSLSTLLKLGGGMLPRASQDRALLVRFETPSVPDSQWIAASDLKSGRTDMPLRDGDHLFVYFISDFHTLPSVEIVGEVARPGSYPIELGRDRLGDLIRRAGGFSPLANRSALHVVRRSEQESDADPEFERLARLSRSEMTESEYATFQTKLSARKNSVRVDFDRLEKLGADVDPLLRHMDLIRVEQRIPSVRVDGQVRRPGWVEFEPGRDVSDYVALAGGYTDRASRSAVRVSRSHTGQVVAARSLRTIEPGDFIWVPERRDVDAWQVFREVIAVAGQIAVIVIATRP